MADALTLQARVESWPLAAEFRIARGTKTSADVVVVELRDGEHSGVGECLPYARYGETPEAVADTLNGLSGDALAAMFHGQPATGLKAADNALDAAYWDLRAQQLKLPVWQLAGLPPPKPVATAFTITIAEPEAMAQNAAAHAHLPVLKIKLGGPDADADGQRLQRIREAAPNSMLIVDANEGWSVRQLEAVLPVARAVGVAMIEQPLPAGDDAVLSDLGGQVPLGADESVLGVADLASLQGKYQVINVKLDKTGGLTAAIELVAAAQALGFELMIGCMVATSMSMAPALLLASQATYVDLDGPLLLRADRAGGLNYDNSVISWPAHACWGEPRGDWETPGAQHASRATAAAASPSKDETDD